MIKTLCVVLAASGLFNTKSKCPAPSAFDRLSDDAVLVSVDGKKLTKADVKLEIRYYDVLAAMAPKSERGGRSMRRAPKAFQVVARAPEDFITLTLLNGYARQASLDCTRYQVSQFILKEARTFGDPEIAFTTRVLSGFDGELRDYAQKRAKDHVLAQIAANHIRSNIVAVTAQDVKKEKVRRKNDNVTARKLNEAAYAAATNVWKRIVSGGSFDTEVKRFADDSHEHIHADGDWGVFEPAAFNEDLLAKAALIKLKPGEVTPPVEYDNGLAILKLIDRDGGNFHIAEIFFELPYFWDETATDESICKDLTVERQENAYRETLERLKKQSDIRRFFGSRDVPSRLR